MQPSIIARSRDFLRYISDNSCAEHQFTIGRRIYFILQRPLPQITAPIPFRNASERLLNFLGFSRPSVTVSFCYTLEGNRIPCLLPTSVLANYVLASDGDYAYRSSDTIPEVFWVKDANDYNRLKSARPGSLGLFASLHSDGSELALSVHGQGRVRVANFDPVIQGTLLKLHPEIYGRVLYVGQTTDSATRFDGHAKLTKALSLRGRNDDIYILTCSFRERCLVRNERLPNVCALQETDDPLITDKDKLTVIERAFIRYFDPPLNERDKGIGALSSQNPVINRSLLAQCYTGIRIPFDPENPMHYIGSPRAGYHPEHHLEFPISPS